MPWIDANDFFRITTVPELKPHPFTILRWNVPDGNVLSFTEKKRELKNK